MAPFEQLQEDILSEDNSNKNISNSNNLSKSASINYFAPQLYHEKINMN